MNKKNIDMFKKSELKNMRRQSLGNNQDKLVITSFLQEGDKFPLVIEPAIKDLNLSEWICSNRDFLEKSILHYGAILFRNFGVQSIEEFSEVSNAVHPELVEYSEPSTPRSEYKDKIYVSSEYPNYHTIHLHTELSYTFKWPMKGLFFCKKAATEGGETPIADSRKIYELIDPKIREKFIQKQVMYLRNYGDGFLIPWEKVFKTNNKKEVEDYCKKNAPMTWEWKEENRLRTRQIRPAVMKHPVTGDTVWFNQAHIFHIYSLGDEVYKRLISEFEEEDLPVNAYYGDGTRIEEKELKEIYRAHKEASYAFKWQEGDIMLLDNMRMSHGRNSFEGEREVVVSFVHPYGI